MGELVIAIALWCSTYNNDSLYYAAKIERTQACRDRILLCVETIKGMNNSNQIECFKKEKLK